MKISWVFDVISPFAYLSLKQLDRLPKHIEIEYVPVLFAGLLNHYGQIGNAEIANVKEFEAAVNRADKTKPIPVLLRRGELATYLLIRPAR